MNELPPLPERNPEVPAEQQGMFSKFEVYRTDRSDAGPGCKHYGCDYFVLDTTHDQHAKAALTAYADAVESTHPELAADMRARYSLAALATQPGSVGEWKRVPVEPTPEMLLRVYKQTGIARAELAEIYAAMLAAAPTEAKPAQQDAVDAWQPISTAPRDGTNILLRWGIDGVSQAKYVPGLPHPWKFIDTNDGVTWLVNHCIDGLGGPSHWMPMPMPMPSAIRAAISAKKASS